MGCMIMNTNTAKYGTSAGVHCSHHPSSREAQVREPFDRRGYLVHRISLCGLYVSKNGREQSVLLQREVMAHVPKGRSIAKVGRNQAAMIGSMFEQPVLAPSFQEAHYSYLPRIGEHE